MATVTTAVRRARAAPSLAALVLVTGISPLATDAYLPALPALQRSLGTSAAVAQLSLTAFLVGLALGQLLVGPVSDASGRRPVLLYGPLAFAGLSVICAVAPTGPLLVLARLLQRLAGASPAPRRAGCLRSPSSGRIASRGSRSRGAALVRDRRHGLMIPRAHLALTQE